MARTGLKSRSISTVEQLIAALEAGGLKPVIARNYEDYPNFGHDLDLFVDGQLHEATEIFTSVAKSLGWDRLTLCTHYAPYAHDDLNIIIFRFHQFEPLQTLQVDLFGGLILWGLTLRNRHTICSSRQLEPQGRFHTMPPEWEQGYRLFQIQSLHPNKEHSKRTRYRHRVLEFHRLHPNRLIQWGKNNNLGNLEPALKALGSDDVQGLSRRIRAAKSKFMLSELVRRPFRTLNRIRDRKRGLHVQFYEQPCGPILNLKGDPDKWSERLDYLVTNQALPGWSIDEDRRERGWALVRFDHPQATPRSLVDILTVIFDRHEVIYSSTEG